MDNEQIFINHPKDVLKILNLENEENEHFVVICLDRYNLFLKSLVLSIGNSNEVTFSTTEIFKQAMIYNAERIIVVHNHPNCRPEPSLGDLNNYTLLEKAGKHHGVMLLDDIILGKNNLTYPDGYHSKVEHFQHRNGYPPAHFGATVIETVI